MLNLPLQSVCNDVPEDKVVVDDLEPGTDEGDGGIGGDVDDWDDETDVELPVN